MYAFLIMVYLYLFTGKKYVIVFYGICGALGVNVFSSYHIFYLFYLFGDISNYLNTSIYVFLQHAISILVYFFLTNSIYLQLIDIPICMLDLIKNEKFTI